MPTLRTRKGGEDCMTFSVLVHSMVLRALQGYGSNKNGTELPRFHKIVNMNFCFANVSGKVLRNSSQDKNSIMHIFDNFG